MITLLATAIALAAPVTEGPRPCRADDVSIAFDDRDGEFNGMSHSGTQLIVRLRGNTTCLLPGLPTLTFLDAKGATLPIERRAPPGMHPGPMVIPVRLAPGMAATTGLRWVSGDVFDKGRCLAPVSVRVTFGGTTVNVPLKASICGEARAPATFEQAPLHAVTASNVSVSGMRPRWRRVR